MKNKTKVTLTFGGIDPDAGAGIYADIKTFSALEVYGIACVTALTSQNTYYFDSYIVPSKKFFVSQIKTLLSDIKPDAIKTGMIPRSWMIKTIKDSIERWNLKNLVIDTVMISKTGGLLMSKDIIDDLSRNLFPLSTLITPNIYEAEYLSGISIEKLDDVKKACIEISKKKIVNNILIKTGHLKTSYICDVLYVKEDGFFEFKHKRLISRSTHGSGCSLTAAIASFLAKGFDIKESVKKAEEYLWSALEKPLYLGKGNGPFDHFWEFKRE